ncbi:MAG: hypothetical protein AMXMBFR75_21870 [Candidatus Hinthialibacteria bacterium]|nr:SGNH/GDSL hydrolase family protein [bacterium]MCC6733240.1 SGNH/GDSL hydrolase family protein [Candidatus Omnitrophota bacterium]MCE7907005.1 SGNH/GDSL hydrolase family protein [Candidatus Omnitrophica bacterium COP1]
MMIKGRLSSILLGLLSASVVVLLAEAGLRLCGYPAGTFDPIMPSTQGLYLPDTTLQMRWGPVPYTIATNSLGLRGSEIQQPKTPGTFRIVAVGDSITDGFFVDNSDTWESVLQERLKSGFPFPVDVVNCAHGGGSIDKELSLLKQPGITLDPDLVVLTFVSNDIYEIVKLLARKKGDGAAASEWQPPFSLSAFLLTHTAIGEASLDTLLRIRFRTYRKSDPNHTEGESDPRYNIPGGDQFEENVKLFMEKYARLDGLVLVDSFHPKVQQAIDYYKERLVEFKSICDQQGCRLLFVYFPAYPQVYQANPPLRINQALNTMCEETSIDFLDLTEGFRKHSAGRVLHLAPLDFHPNPEGNRLFAELLEQHLLPIVANHTSQPEPDTHSVSEPKN